jgi:hypothetical protein
MLEIILAHNPCRVGSIVMLMMLHVIAFNPGCQAGHWEYQGRILGIGQSAHWSHGKDSRHALGLSPVAQDFHLSNMEDHMDAVQDLVQLLVWRDYDRAKTLTQARLGFAMHRQVMKQQPPANFPREYHRFAMTHHQAAEDLAQVIGSRNPKEIRESFDHMIDACAACHHAYKY